MSIVHSLSSLALKGVAVTAGEVVGVKVVGEAGDAVVGFLQKRFTDHSQRLTRALQRANERAWKALEIALAGDSWWERCKGRLASGEQKSFRQQVQQFLDAAPLSAGEPAFRQDCLRQLQAARKTGALFGGNLEPAALARQAGAFARFADPTALLDAEWRTVADMAGEMKEMGYPALAQLLEMRPAQGQPLLLAAARYFFRREIETDRELFQGIAFARLEELNQGQASGFAALSDALAQHGERLEELLDEVRSVVVETRADVLDIKGELQRQGQQMQELGQAVLQALQQHHLERRQLNPGDSLSIRGDAERQMVKSLVARYRALPAAQRRGLPALLNAIGKLEVVSGDFAAAQRDFTEVVGLVGNADARAEAHANAYQAALEQRNWPEALTALRQAATLDPERFAPFSLSKFEPERILGAGGFGVAFLCRNRHSGSRVVIKTLRGDTLDRDLGEVFREAQVLEELDHAAIIRVRDCDYADAARSRPYVVMDYFPGQNLAEHVENHGPLSVAELLPLAQQIAEGLQAAHTRNILHRDVKPANLLVQHAGDGWQIKLIDFGLAMRGRMLQSTARSQGDRTLTSSSLAGTLDYAAPEQMGRLKGVPVASYSDVYSFAKTCCFALFQTPQPTFQHWQKLPPPLAELLGQCLAETPKDRPADFAIVLRRLSRLPGPTTRVIRSEPIMDVLPVREPVRSVRPRRERERERDEPETPRRERSRSYLWPVLIVVAIMIGALGLGLVLIFRHPFTLRPIVTNTPAPFTIPSTAKPEAELPPEPFTDKELADALKEWKTADANRKIEIARRLSMTPAKDEYRAQTLAILHAFLGIQRSPAGLRKDELVVGNVSFAARDPKAPAVRALGVWGTKEHVPLLMDLVANFSQDVRWAAMGALVDLGDERGAKAIAGRLTDQWDRSLGPVTRCLIALGPKAEAAVIPHLENTNHWVRLDACKILTAIGSEKSIPPLEKATTNSDRIFQRHAMDALKTVRDRVASRGDAK